MRPAPERDPQPTVEVVTGPGVQPASASSTSPWTCSTSTATTRRWLPREIADDLGFTKAALYYHFERKEDILLALHLRLHALGRDMLDQLGSPRIRPPTSRCGPGCWTYFIDQVLANRKLFLLHARKTQNALEPDPSPTNTTNAEHQDMEEQLRRSPGRKFHLRWPFGSASPARSAP